MKEEPPKPPSRSSKLKGKKVLIKIGGSSIAGKEALESFAQNIALLVGLGIRPVVVHGGGPEINEEMKRRGLPVQKVAGLRVTDDETLKVANEVLARINEEIVYALKRVQVKAVGLQGAERDTLVARKLDPVKVKDENGNEVSVDLGNVGEVCSVDPLNLNNLINNGFVPVIYPICSTKDYKLMNVNADTAAAHIAKTIKAEEMILITDVPGIMREFGKPDTTIKEVTVAQLQQLINEGVVSGGMIPKAQACELAVLGGVKAVHMLDGREKDAIVNQLLSGENLGTMVTL
ncbi:MAG: acetylglutamate kinase [Methanomassiliicoccales archaeon]|jgi:acetylglutamate kinase|nr:acetylglutamate kinase [Methanomassiliicoccales archaeon]MDD1755221.1 acetylglutamate kinase [Methanomassiliicoccales archaeon]